MFSKKVLFIICLFSLMSCGYIRIPKNEYGEPVLKEKVKYTFLDMPTETDLKKIDTSAYYVQIFEGRYYNNGEKENPQILKFHNDGFFKKFMLIGIDKNVHRNKNSIYYGGKYKIKENIIQLEQFYPSTGGATNYYIRNVRKGKIDGNKIIFNSKNSLLTIFEKKQSLN
ncbi:hypothetical protein [Flavobacterium luteolum]|uniref:hypothetical protein n=1 Tax=Flavobacterium luteolum TaxID=3003259 RepID=UPI00248E0C40|nr:hypothetical protein [Flavobacterium luteolum]